MSKMKKTLASSQEVTTRTAAAEKLRQIADKIDQGELVLKGTKDQQISIPDSVELEIKYKEKTKKTGLKKFELEIEIEWVAESGETLEIG